MFYSLDYRPDGSTPSEIYLQYGEVYKDAINALLEKYTENPPAHSYSSAPIVFLLRQYIELQLKGIIMYNETSHEVVGGHDIRWLYNKAIETINAHYGIEYKAKPPENCVEFIECLGKVDSKADLGRYPETKQGADVIEKITKEEAWLIDTITLFPKLKDMAEKIIDYLENIEGFLDYTKENEQESWANAEPP